MTVQEVVVKANGVAFRGDPSPQGVGHLVVRSAEFSRHRAALLDFLLLLEEEGLGAAEKLKAFLTTSPYWLPHTVTVARDNPRKLSYAKRPEEAADYDRRVMAGWGKLLGKLRHDYDLELTDGEIEDLANRAGQHFYDLESYTFKIVRGNDLIEAYATGPSSCMAGKDHLLEIYAANPEKVALLKIYRKGRYMGRALLWHTDQGWTVMDRIYPSDEGDHIKAAIRYAEAQGWDYTPEQTYGVPYASGRRYTVTLRWKDILKFPRIDNMCYGVFTKEALVLTNTYPDANDEWPDASFAAKFEGLTGEVQLLWGDPKPFGFICQRDLGRTVWLLPSKKVVYSERYDRYIFEDEAIRALTVYGEDYIYKEDAIWSDVLGTFLYIEDAVGVYRAGGRMDCVLIGEEIVYSDYYREDILEIEAVWSRALETYLLKDEAVEVLREDGEYDWLPKDKGKVVWSEYHNANLWIEEAVCVELPGGGKGWVFKRDLEALEAKTEAEAE